MIKRKNLWFLTLFSLVLVLSIYYVTMPADLLEATTTVTDVKEKKNVSNDVTVNAEESDVISALKVEDDAKTSDTLNELQKKITNSATSTEDKNSAYEEIKTINSNSSLEDSLEKKIKAEYKCNAFTKIENSSVKVVVDECENSKSLANNIMRLVQAEFDKKMYISVKFSS